MLRRLLLLIKCLLHSLVKECTALSVVEIRQVTAYTRRVNFSGKGLEAFETRENLHVRLLLPPAGLRRDTWLKPHRDGRAAVRQERLKPVFRKYTVHVMLLDDAIAGGMIPGDRRRAFVRVGAEFLAFQAIGSRLRGCDGLRKEEQHVVAYWRRGAADAE